MREENLQALRERIRASFERARVEAPAPKKISEEERREKTARYADLLFRAALKKL